MKASARPSISNRSESRKVAVRTTKTPETSKTVMISLKRRNSLRLAILEFAKVTPRTVTVSRPLSSSTRSDNEYPAMTTTKIKGILRYSGTCPRTNRNTRNRPR